MRTGRPKAESVLGGDERRELTEAVHEFIRVYNETAQPYVRAKTAAEILADIARFAQRTLQAHGA